VKPLRKKYSRLKETASLRRLHLPAQVLKTVVHQQYKIKSIFLLAQKKINGQKISHTQDLTIFSYFFLSGTPLPGGILGWPVQCSPSSDATTKPLDASSSSSIGNLDHLGDLSGFSEFEAYTGVSLCTLVGDIYFSLKIPEEISFKFFC